MMLTAAEYLTLSRDPAELTDTELERAIADAEEAINALTYNRITARGFDALTPYQQQRVKLAIARQVDFRRRYGELLDNPLASYSINGVSMAWDKSAIQQISGVQTCAEVTSPLMQTGLMCGVIG